MATLAFAWELGLGSGYCGLIARIARTAVAAGHRCDFIVRDLHIARRHIPAELGRLVQAPQAGERSGSPVAVQTSYATLLHNCGFDDADDLDARVGAWQALFRLLGSDRLLARHSPTAILAARLTGLPTLHYGSGFSIPPATTPWPSFRPDLELPDNALRHNEERVLDVVNAVRKRRGCGDWPQASALFEDLPTALLGDADTDHYHHPRSDPFVGLPDLSHGDAPVWPETGSGPRLFVSLPPAATDWLSLLADLPASCLVRFLGPATIPRELPGNVRITRTPVNFGQAISSADAVLGYGSHNLVYEALVAGRPIAVIAQNPDQLLMAFRVRSLGAGISAGIRADDAARRALIRWLSDADGAFTTTRSAAIDFAASRPERVSATARACVPDRLLKIALTGERSPVA